MPQRTSKITFELQEKQSNVRIGEAGVFECGWFRITQHDHSKKGLDFCIPLEHPEYSRSLASELEPVCEGDKVKMVLESVNPARTAWICYEIER